MRGGPEVREFSVHLEVVTPILGGGVRPRALDEVDVIRPSAVRGYLRFWWRALHGHRFATARQLYEHESSIWGRASVGDGGRSAVEIRIDVDNKSSIDTTNIHLHASKEAAATPGAYALWPARAEKGSNTPPAPRRRPGTRFRVVVITPSSLEQVVRNALRAWILFGGYGARTRRGLGSLAVLDEAAAWLPHRATREDLEACFESDVFADPANDPGDLPSLAGASLHVGQTRRNPTQAWTEALDWLHEFRQGTKGGPGDRAREPGSGKLQPQRPSISNWPEADKVRHFSTLQRSAQWAHRPRHNASPAWPRAGFGLPIIGQFQQQSRLMSQGRPLRWNQLPPTDPNHGTEPGPFELRWRCGSVEHDRLASPLIVKALPLADGTFVPCALWLNRAYPDGEVILRGAMNSGAPFDRLVAAGDTARFSALSNKGSLREAFLGWLQSRHGTTVVA